MKKVVFALLCIVVCALCSSTAKAWLVPDTGDPNERNCNTHSYTDLGSGIIKDHVTGLMWQKATAPGTYTWQQAVDYCNNLSLGGHTDWHLPTVKEISTLVDVSIKFPGPLINSTYFPNTEQSDYWSSTTFSDTPDSAYFMDFENGIVYGYKDKIENSYVRAVRGNSAPNNFVDNGDGTITDTSTGLMWEKLAQSTTYFWPQAKDYCENLILGEKSDWRLPTRNELQTIVDYTRKKPSIDTTFFPDTAGVSDYDYWSSTKYANDPDETEQVWYVNFYSGYINHTGKRNYNFVRAVRAGLCGPFYCPITDVLGADNPKLKNLRAFRDSKFAQNTVGRKIIAIYYNNADSINAALEKSPALRAVFKRVLEVIAPILGR